MSSVLFGLGSLPFLLFRFMPVILFGMFSFLSLFHQDVRSLLYSIGLFVVCVLAVFVSRAFPLDFNKKLDGCSKGAFMLTEDEPLSSNISLNVVMYAYTFAYLLTAMIRKKTVVENMPIVVFFVTLIVAELAWNAKCYSNSFRGLLLDAMAVGGGGVLGAAWALIILRANKAEWLYLTGLSTRETCTRPTNQKFVCKKKTF